VRIVSLLPSATEILFAIGLGDEVVAITHECDYPPQAQHLPLITASAIDHEGRSCAEIDRHIKHAVHAGSSIYRLDEAALARLRPDLIVTQELCEVCAVSYREVDRAARCLSAGCDIISLEPSSIADILATNHTVGDRCGHPQEAAELTASLQDRMDRVAARPQPSPRPRVVCVEWSDPLMAGGHWVPEMVSMAGGTDVLGQAGQPSEWVDADAIARSSPDLVVLMPCGFDLPRTVEIGRKLLNDPVAAAWIGDAAVVAVDGSAYFNRPGPRIVDGVELLAEIFRDELSRSPRGAWLRR
jgi:iron complex transport system substrate-binding protein